MYYAVWSGVWCPLCPHPEFYFYDADSVCVLLWSQHALIICKVMLGVLLWQKLCIYRKSARKCSIILTFAWIWWMLRNSKAYSQFCQMDCWNRSQIREPGRRNPTPLGLLISASHGIRGKQTSTFKLLLNKAAGWGICIVRSRKYLEAPKASGWKILSRQIMIKNSCHCRLAHIENKMKENDYN